MKNCSEMTTPRCASIQNGTKNISFSFILLNFPVYYLFLVKNDKLLWEIERTVVGRYLSRNFGWSADFGKPLAIIHWSSQLVCS